VKIRLVEAELFSANRLLDGQADRQTERRNGANSRFSQFCEKA